MGRGFLHCPGPSDGRSLAPCINKEERAETHASVVNDTAPLPDRPNCDPRGAQSAIRRAGETVQRLHIANQGNRYELLRKSPCAILPDSFLHNASWSAVRRLRMRTCIDDLGLLVRCVRSRTQRSFRGGVHLPNLLAEGFSPYKGTSGLALHQRAST